MDWSDGWVAIGATKAWSLSSGDGTKTVYMMLKDDPSLMYQLNIGPWVISKQQHQIKSN